MWMTSPREHVLRYWAEWLRIDAGALLPTLRVPVLAMYAVAKDDADPSRFRAGILQDFTRNHASASVNVIFIAGATHAIWESQPVAFDEQLAAFAAGRARSR
jgi:pimeloyl-ACP methyl ester carboxylesterase